LIFGTYVLIRSIAPVPNRASITVAEVQQAPKHNQDAGIERSEPLTHHTVELRRRIGRADPMGNHSDMNPTISVPLNTATLSRSFTLAQTGSPVPENTIAVLNDPCTTANAAETTTTVHHYRKNGLKLVAAAYLIPKIFDKAKVLFSGTSEAPPEPTILPTSLVYDTTALTAALATTTATYDGEPSAISTGSLGDNSSTVTSFLGSSVTSYLPPQSTTPTTTYVSNQSTYIYNVPASAAQTSLADSVSTLVMAPGPAPSRVNGTSVLAPASQTNGSSYPSFDVSTSSGGTTRISHSLYVTVALSVMGLFAI
jgi:hypothetical protein